MKSKFQIASLKTSDRAINQIPYRSPLLYENKIHYSPDKAMQSNKGQESEPQLKRKQENKVVPIPGSVSMMTFSFFESGCPPISRCPCEFEFKSPKDSITPPLLLDEDQRMLGFQGRETRETSERVPSRALSSPSKFILLFFLLRLVRNKKTVAYAMALKRRSQYTWRKMSGPRW